MKRVIICVVVIVLVISACALVKPNNDTSGVILKDFKSDRVDKEPLLNRFTNLCDFDSCLWQSGVISNGNSDLGPTSYMMRGYIILNKKDFDVYKSEYQWKRQEKLSLNSDFVLENGEYIPTPDFDEFGITNSKWAYSEVFNDYIKGDFIGSFYLDLNNGVLFFDVQNK